MTSIKFQLNCNKNSLSHRYEQLLHSEKYYDCLFHVCGMEIRCHKLILASASPVFEAMFYGPLQEKQPLEIEILDISADIFRLLITYIYTGMVDYASLSLAQTIELQYSAEKYLIDELNAESLQAASKKLRYANILPALELSVCMHLDKLKEICLKFFRHCCLSEDAQFSKFLQNKNYIHISRESLKVLWTSLSNEQQHQILWLILLWCQHECDEYGLQHSDIPLLLDDMQLNTNLAALQRIPPAQLTSYKRGERLYYKASRPFFIDGANCVWKLQLKCDRFIRLLGITMHSRLKPQTVQIVGTGCHSSALSMMIHLPDDYKEELSIDISSLTARDHNHHSDDEDESDQETAEPQARQPRQHEQCSVIWQHKYVQRAIKYNCDVNITWENGIVLSPDFTYEMTLKWPESAYSAEYPCSLLSNEIDGIQFNENVNNGHAGSLIKGLCYSDLI